MSVLFYIIVLKVVGYTIPSNRPTQSKVEIIIVESLLNYQRVALVQA